MGPAGDLRELDAMGRKGEARLRVALAERAGADSQEVAPGVVLDFDAEGKLVGMDIDHASSVVNLSRLEAESLPVSDIAFTAA